MENVASMQQLRRLLRYVLPYWSQLLGSILLMAGVGLLDAFRVLLIGPIFDRVLNPGSQTRTMELFKLPFSDRVVTLQQFVPSHFQNPWTVVAFALVAATVLKGIFDYAGTYLVNYAGYRTDHRPARRPLQLHPAQVGRILFQTHHRHADLDHRQRHRARAIRHVQRARGIPAAILHAHLHRICGGPARRQAGLGSAAVYSRHHFFSQEKSAGRCGARPAAVRTSSRKSRTSCTRPSPATAS